MDSSTPSNKPAGEKAILFDRVSKHYRLVPEKKGLFGGSAPADETVHVALRDISFAARPGERIGLIGRNGAGKTTLLKLIAANHKPTSGDVVVNGRVQALMTMGYGFHQEQTGYENIRSSLRFNGLDKADTERAFADIIDFCELGPFLHQPIKTYSSGMLSRLMFACATAINPDILIVDEILGAGDAYFTAKSKFRVQRMVRQGCTMLLVSHSMPQILELCDRAIWLESGEIRMMGDALSVVKAYEQNISGRVAQLLGENPDTSIAEAAVDAAIAGVTHRPGVRYQTPAFVPHTEDPQIAATPDANFAAFDAVDRTGISRWDGNFGLKISGFSVRGADAGLDPGVIETFKPAMFTIFLKAERSGEFNCRCGIAIFDLMDRPITRLWGPADHFSIEEGQYRRVDILLNPNQLGAGEYRVGISVHDGLPLEMISNAKRYDLLSRSFTLKVEMADSLNAAEALFMHSSEWSFATLLEDGSRKSDA